MLPSAALTDSLSQTCPSILCGPQSLLVVCRCLGSNATLDELVSLSGYGERSGANPLGLRKAAEAKGLCAVGMKIGAEDLARLTIPAIAHQWGNHFVAVESGGPDALKVTDPPAEQG